MSAVIPARPEPPPALSPLELAVIRDAAYGLTAEDTAGRLRYSVSYVNRLRTRAMAALGVATMPAAVLAATRHGLIR